MLTQEQLDRYGITYDTAVPQDFSDRARVEADGQTWGNIVWGYSKYTMFGRPIALTEEGDRILDVLGDEPLDLGKYVLRDRAGVQVVDLRQPDTRSWIYALEPVQAVVVAYLQNEPTTAPPPELTFGRLTVACGDYCAFLKGKP